LIGGCYLISHSKLLEFDNPTRTQRRWMLSTFRSCNWKWFTRCSSLWDLFNISFCCDCQVCFLFLFSNLYLSFIRE
jgi:hypothetical protein